MKETVTRLKITLTMALMLLLSIFYVTDAYAADAPHVPEEPALAANCTDCHYTVSNVPTWLTQTIFTGDGTKMNLMCWECHNVFVLPEKYTDIKTHSSNQTTTTYGTWVMECRTCHNVHYQAQARVYNTDPNSYLISGVVSTIQSGATSTVKINETLTADYTNYIFIPNKSYPNYMHRILSDTTGTGTFRVLGKVNLTYAKTGSAWGLKYGKMIKDKIATPKSSMRTVRFFKNEGINSFADTDGDGAATDDVCQVCHTQTKYFKNDGTLEGPAHPASSAGRDCIKCHLHNKGFLADCHECHGTPPVVNTTGGPYGLANSDGGTGSTTPGAHQRHAVTLGYECDACHAGGMPESDVFDKKIQIGFSIGTFQTGTYDGRILPLANGYSYTRGNAGTAITNGGNMQCSNIYCHSKGQSNTGGALSGVDYAAPQWTAPATGQCGTCHNISAGSTPPTSGSHPKHAGAGASGNYAFACTACHYGFAETYSIHANGKVNVTVDPQYGSQAVASADGADAQRGFASSTCSNTYCHSNGASVSAGAIPSNTSANWGSGTLACNACHGNPPNYTNGPSKANNHASHGYTCDKCHYSTTTTGSTIADPTKHVNKIYDLTPGISTSFTYTYASPGGSCGSISCHSNTGSTWGASACLDCHLVSQGNRVAVVPQFSANSHHIQGVSANGTHCYQCHWEANDDGSINASYHGGSASPGSGVDLVIYGAGARPTIHSSATATRYTSTNTRAEIQKINSHCLGCHSDQNNSTIPFGDGKKPKHYAWDGTSVGLRYSETGTTTWGKYSGANVTPKNTRTKAYSAHGNAVNNEGGWNTSETWPNTRAGSANVACFDCHNSHGSNIAGITSSYTSSTSNGGILKETAAGKGGYSITYQPQSGGTSSNKNVYNPGAALCFDCHMSANASTTTPWGYSGTFGAAQAVMGYWDSAYFGPGTFGSQQRYPYKETSHKGGHFGASSSLSSTPSGTTNGLCTPCHDPHGVSAALGADQQYAVPLLKGTWLTSPYKEDAAPLNNSVGTKKDGLILYHIDQNTFGADINSSITPLSQSDSQFAGLCLGCHSKSSLTDGTTHTWKNKNRVHESVKGWKTANGTIQHNYACSKCHTPHNARLPRLMVTNCLDGKHKGQVASNPSAVLTSSGGGYPQDDTAYCYGNALYCGQIGNYSSGSGSGRIPGNYSGSVPGTFSVTCHENNTGSGTDQSWNSWTQW